MLKTEDFWVPPVRAEKVCLPFGRIRVGAGALTVPCGASCSWEERLTIIGFINFQPKGLARIKKKPSRPRATPSTTKRMGEILPGFIG